MLQFLHFLGFEDATGKFTNPGYPNNSLLPQSLEAMWLAFLMLRAHGRRWDGAEWSDGS